MTDPKDIIAELNTIIAEQKARLDAQESQISELYGDVVKLQLENRALQRKAATSLANNLCPDHRDKQEGKPCLACGIDRLRELLDRCDVVMDTSAMHGLPQTLPPAYKDSWAMVHQQVRAELRKGAEAKADNVMWIVG